jgi:hypothetical protein
VAATAQDRPFHIAPDLLLVGLCVHEHRMAHTADVRVGTPFSNVASVRASMLSDNCNAVLVAGDTTVAIGGTHTSFNHNPLSIPRGFSKHSAFSIPRLLRARTLSNISEHTAYQ